MKRTILTALILGSVGCAQIPASFERTPEIGKPSQAFVGDSMYKVYQTGSEFHDYMNGTSSNASGEGYEIMYSGVSKGQLRLAYREYVQPRTGGSRSSAADLYIRPSFSQELTYDYDGGPQTFTVRTVKIDVTEADQEQIHYTIKSGFRNEAQMEAQDGCSSFETCTPAMEVKEVSSE